MQKKQSSLQRTLILLVKEGSDKFFIWKTSMVASFAMQNPCVSRGNFPGVCEILRLLRIESVWFFNLLIVDVHLSFEKKMSANCCLQKYWEILEPLPRNLLPPQTLCFLLGAACQDFCFCKFDSYDLRQISVSKPIKTVSNQCRSSDSSEIQILCIFHQVKCRIHLFARGMGRHFQLLGLFLQGSQKRPVSVDTAIYFTRSTKKFCWKKIHSTN